MAAGEVGKVRAELAAYEDFAALSAEIVEVNEAICEARPPDGACQQPRPASEPEKGGSASG